MYVILLGILCGVTSAVVILVTVCLCHRYGFSECLATRKSAPDYPVITFPMPDTIDMTGRKHYVQPRFTNGGDLLLDPRHASSTPGPVDATALRDRLAELASDSESAAMRLGRLEFSLSYDSDDMELDGVVVGASQLAVVRGRAPTTCVQVTLLPGQHYQYRTASVRENVSPRFGERFRFGVVDLDELAASGLLQFRVYHSDWLKKEELIGWIDVPLAEIGKRRLAGGEVRENRPLRAASDLVSVRSGLSYSSQSSRSGTPIMSSSMSLPYLAQSSLDAVDPKRQLLSIQKSSSMERQRHSDGGTLSDSELSDGHQTVRRRPKRRSVPRRTSRHSKTGGGMIQLSVSYSEENGRLLVIVLKAKDLPMRKGDIPPDVYIKMHLLSSLDKRKVSKKRTTLKRSNPDPIFNESFSLHCPVELVDHVSLVVSVMDHPGSGSGSKASTLIGQIVLGTDASGEREARHWLDTFSHETAGRNITAWHTLKK
eukprot:m.308547 g.308547  ORF g.308547 m.308547 type:complete len:484 (+) comp44198_c0_seq1:104-1555(+)